MHRRVVGDFVDSVVRGSLVGGQGFLLGLKRLMIVWSTRFVYSSLGLSLLSFKRDTVSLAVS